MSVIAPKFRLGYLLKGVLNDVFWIIVLITLIGLPVIMIVLFYIDMPVLEGELLTPFLGFTMIAHPELAMPLIDSFMNTDFFRIAVFPVISAPVVIPIAIAEGKLNGAIIPQTP